MKLFCVLFLTLALGFCAVNTVNACDGPVRRVVRNTACVGYCATARTVNYFRYHRPVRRVATAPVRYFYYNRPVRRAACRVFCCR